MIVGQRVVSSRVDAADDDHAASESLRAINESLDLLRYGQLMASGPPAPVPELGMMLLSPNGLYWQHHSFGICLDKPSASTHKLLAPCEGANYSICRTAPAWDALDCILKTLPSDRSDIAVRLVRVLAWVGQACLASVNYIKIVAMVTALESLLIQDHEQLGKRVKLKNSVSGFNQLSTSKIVISNDIADDLYTLRSRCVHGGSLNVTYADMERACIAVAQCIFGVMGDPYFAGCATQSDLIKLLEAKTRPSPPLEYCI